MISLYDLFYKLGALSEELIAPALLDKISESEDAAAVFEEFKERIECAHEKIEERIREKLKADK